MDQMVDMTIDGEPFGSLRVSVTCGERTPGENEFVAQAQVELAKLGYVLDNEVTYRVREPKAGERTVFASDE